MEVTSTLFGPHIAVGDGHEVISASISDHVGFDKTRHNQVVVITPTTWPSRSRLGVFSTVTDLSHPWVPRPNIRLLLQELGVEDGDISVLVVDHQPSLEINDYGIDLRPYVARLE